MKILTCRTVLSVVLTFFSASLYPMLENVVRIDQLKVEGRLPSKRIFINPYRSTKMLTVKPLIEEQDGRTLTARDKWWNIKQPIKFGTPILINHRGIVRIEVEGYPPVLFEEQDIKKFGPRLELLVIWHDGVGRPEIKIKSAS